MVDLGTARELWLNDTGRSGTASGAFDALVSRYREPHRQYHGVAHVRRVLADVNELMRAVVVSDPAAVRLAAWYHDAIYAPRSSTNEQDSADLADRELAEVGISDDRRREVARLILLTAGHVALDPAVDPAGAVLLDADLAVLSAEPAVYDAYVNGVRSEYQHVDDAAWRSGRAGVLHRFLDAARIYSTATMSAREPRARANLTAELATLHELPG